MADLVAIAFPSEQKAEEVRQKLLDLHLAAARLMILVLWSVTVRGHQQPNISLIADDVPT